MKNIFALALAAMFIAPMAFATEAAAPAAHGDEHAAAAPAAAPADGAPMKEHGKKGKMKKEKKEKMHDGAAH